MTISSFKGAAVLPAVRKAAEMPVQSPPALGQAQEPILSQNTTESLVITFPRLQPRHRLGRTQCEVIEVVLPIKCVRY